jgi:hypothetical protein
MTLKQLYPAYETAMMVQNIGDEAERAATENKWAWTPSVPGSERLGECALERRVTIPREIRVQIRQTYEHLYNKEAQFLDIYAHEDGYGGHFSLWDHNQHRLKEAVCGKEIDHNHDHYPLKDTACDNFPNGPNEESIWQDTSDEDE